MKIVFADFILLITPFPVFKILRLLHFLLILILYYLTVVIILLCNIRTLQVILLCYILLLSYGDDTLKLRIFLVILITATILLIRIHNIIIADTENNITNIFNNSYHGYNTTDKNSQYYHSRYRK
jgi:hypothetical protein